MPATVGRRLSARWLRATIGAGGTYERLADIKRRYDPRNLFRMNQNIRPAPLG